MVAGEKEEEEEEKEQARRGEEWGEEVEGVGRSRGRGREKLVMD